jgi:sulfur carrier protein ThiS
MGTAELHPKGILKNYTQGQIKIVVESGFSLRKVLIDSGIPPELVAMAFVNEIPKDKDEIISEGEIIDLVAVIGGG